MCSPVLIIGQFYFEVCPFTKAAFELLSYQKDPYHNPENETHVIISESDSSFNLSGCWPLVPKFAGSNPVEFRWIFQSENIFSTPSFGREVKPFILRRIFAACKRTRKCMRGSRSFRSKLPAISRPSSSSFHY